MIKFGLGNMWIPRREEPVEVIALGLSDDPKEMQLDRALMRWIKSRSTGILRKRNLRN